MYPQIKARIEQALQALKQGRSVIVLDDHDRENEGDLIFPGELANDKNVNMMLQHASGIVCLAMSPEHAQQLNLYPMVAPDKNNSQYTTPFTVTIEAKEGVTTGVSAADRAHTIRVASNPEAHADEISRPGHVFPLVANPYGVLGRQGHTEGSVDLVKMAGFYPCAVLCELMNNDGTMMKGKQIEDFAEQHNLPILSIEDIRLYRLANEVFVHKAVTTKLPLKDFGEFDMSVYQDPTTKQEVVVLSTPYGDNPVVRMHSSCITGDLFGSLKCDCQSQLHHGLREVKQHGGMLIYLNQEGRNIGLVNKLKAYHLQDTRCLDTEEANRALGLPVDARRYDLAIQVLKHEGIEKCRLISNNPDKLKALADVNIQVERMPSISSVHAHNEKYLKTKQSKFNHDIKGV